MPIARTTLLDLLRMQDRIANKAQDIAGIMLGRKMQIPASMAEPMMDYLACSLSVTSQAVDTLNELDELVVTGFRGRGADVVEKMVRRLEALESDTDSREKQLRLMLFKLEKDLSPVDAMFLYNIIDWIGQLADRAQQVGSRFMLLLAR
jgi:predicted phosphate transport protein (TIGR00153 family)